jgi:hypothetical protein
MIIGLSGYAQSGKDTVAGMLIGLYGYENVAFASNIRKLLYEMDPFINDGQPVFRLQDLIDSQGWENAKATAPEVRRLLQDLGVGARALFGKNFWVDQVLNTINPTNRIVITDVRFQNEAEEIKKIEGSQIWRINRPGVGPVNNHISETDMDLWDWDAVITNNNDNDMQALINQIKSLLG